MLALAFSALSLSTQVRPESNALDAKRDRELREKVAADLKAATEALKKADLILQADPGAPVAAPAAVPDAAPAAAPVAAPIAEPAAAPIAEPAAAPVAEPAAGRGRVNA